jgi:transketolase
VLHPLRAQVHDGPLGQEDTRHIKAVYGFDPDQSFVVPPEVAAFYAAAGRRGGEAHAAWRRTWDAYRVQRPGVAAEFARRFLDPDKPLPDGWFERLPRWSPDDKPEPTR